VLPHQDVRRRGRRLALVDLWLRRRRRDAAGSADFFKCRAQRLREIRSGQHFLQYLAAQGGRQRLRPGFDPALGRDLRGLELQHRQFRSGGGGHRRGNVAEQQVEKREIGGGRRRSGELGSGRSVLRERIGRPQHAVAEFICVGGVALASAVEQRLAHRLDAHPVFRIGVELGAVLFDPERRRGGDLRSGGRSPVAVEVDDGRLPEAGPWDVRRVGGDRRPHLSVGTVIAGHPGHRKIGVGSAVGHHAACRDHAAEAPRIDDETRRLVGVVVSRGRHDDHACLVQCVDRVGPRLRGQSSHAHAHDMHARCGRGAELVNVVETARDGAIAEQHHPVGDANRNDFGVRCAAEGLQPRNGRAGQDAERAAAVTEIIENAGRPVGRVSRSVGIHEIASEISAKIFGDRFVGGVVSGVEMCDTDALT
jgi:hypothetical protein